MEIEETKVKTSLAGALSGLLVIFALSLLLLAVNAALILGAAFALVWGATDSIAHGFGVLNGTAGVAGLSYLLYRIFDLFRKIAVKR